MPVDEDPTVELVDQLVQNVQKLDLKENELDSTDKGDDGYSSSSSDAKDVSPIQNDDDKDKDEESEDDEKILEPLIVLEHKPKELCNLEYISRGPVSNADHRPPRFTPYRRPDQAIGAGDLCLAREEEGGEQPLPKLLIPTCRQEPDHLINIDVKMAWTDKHELSIAKYMLPDGVIFVKQTGQVKVHIQLDPNIRDMKSFDADVKIELNQDGIENKFIGPIVISIKQDLMDSQEKMLLAELKEEDYQAARDLVYNKDISNLVSVIGPRQDTVLAILCAKGKSNPGAVTGQIYHLVQRLLHSPDPSHVHNVFKLNKSGISAFEIATITNNSLVACYLAEVMYNLVEDTKTALKLLNSMDSQGNNIIHLLARKGDISAETLRRLLAMRLTDNSRVFSLESNSKHQSPLHIATQGSNQPETIGILNQAINNGFDAQDDDGMTPLHYAAQRSTDPQLIQTILSYKKDNINLARKDGLMPLDLLSLRPNQAANDGSGQNAYPIDKKVQLEMTKLLKDNGAKSCIDDQRSPMVGQNVNEMMGSNPSSPKSPVGSPFSSTASPRTLPDDCPVNIYTSMRVAGSVESYVQSSPESEHCDFINSATTTRNQNYTFNPDMLANTSANNYQQQQQGVYGNQNGGVGVTMNNAGAGAGASFDLEDHIASQILHEFPEIRGYVGQIMDGNL